ncbi:MAG: replication-relaxation family protein [Chloroflexota bacterium]
MNPLKRDLKVLQFIGKGGIASISQIQTKFWPEAKERTCLERLQILKKEGLLTKQIVTSRKSEGELVFLITPEGSKLFSRSIQARFFHQITTAEIKQQLLAQDAILKLEQELIVQGKVLVDWKQEREIRSLLKRQQKKGDTSQLEVPDAQATVRDETTGEIYKVEIEVDGAYYGKMLQSKINRFAASNKPTIWVTTSDRAAMIITKISNHPNITLLVV